MPVTRNLVRCQRCNNMRASAHMFVLGGICNTCYETHYRLCDNCGELIVRTGTTYNRGSYYSERHVSGDVYRANNGALVCGNCLHHSRNTERFWRSNPFHVSIATYQRVGSSRKYGVEIETSYSPNHYSLRNCTNFGCKPDCSIDGYEFDSPILYGDEGFKHIEDFLQNAADLNWEVDDCCGCHTHYDMRNESDVELYRVAYAYALSYPMWECLVSRDRRSKSYCSAPCYTPEDIYRASSDGLEFYLYSEEMERYDFLNLLAYADHQTFENRLLEGTLDAETICNWIALNARFIDQTKELIFSEIRELFGGSPQSKFKGLIDIIGNTDLTDWVAYRARRVGQRPLRGPGSAR